MGTEVEARVDHVPVEKKSPRSGEVAGKSVGKVPSIIALPLGSGRSRFGSQQ